MLPMHIIATLDNIAFGIAQKENFDINELKDKITKNINALSSTDFSYLEEQMNILIEKSLHNEETIDDTNVEKSFISFLIRLYY